MSPDGKHEALDVMEANDHDLLIRMDEKMDAVLAWQTEHMAKCHATHEKHEGRLTKLEEWKYREAGALAVLVFLLQFAGEWMMGLVGLKHK